jgi:hypothetical protein
MQSIKQSDLSVGDLEQQELAQLAERSALSLVNANLAVPIDLALAANVLSDGSAAIAQAVQTTPINQGI